MRKVQLTIGLLALAASLALAQETAPTLKVGDPAPKLQPGKWIHGPPVTNFEKGKAYIVEFWATWCVPCRASIPHLNEIYLAYKDKGLIVIGQNCLEPDPGEAEKYVKAMGTNMTYRVALDEKKDSQLGRVWDTWMTPAGRDGIPMAFLVDTQSRIAWIGHPLDLTSKLIEDVLAGKYDPQKTAANNGPKFHRWSDAEGPQVGDGKGNG